MEGQGIGISERKKKKEKGKIDRVTKVLKVP